MTSTREMKYATPARAALRLPFAMLVILATASPALAQFPQLPPGFEGLMQAPGGGGPVIMPGAGGARGIDCGALAELSRQGRPGPGGMDPQQIMDLMRCPSAPKGGREKDPVASGPTAESFCGMLRHSLEDVGSGAGGWLGPMPVHAAAWMLRSCRAQVTPAEMKAWEGLARFGDGRYAESAAALREAAAQAPDEPTRVRFTMEMAKSLIAAGRTAEAREAVERALSLADKLFPEGARGSQRGWFLSQQQAMQQALEADTLENRQRARRALRGELLVLRGLIDLNDNNLPPAVDGLREASRLLSPELPEMPEMALRDPGAALADVYLAMALQRTGRGDEAMALLQKLIGGRDQFVGMAGQTQGTLELAQDMISGLGNRAGGINLPQFEIPKNSMRGMESGMMMSGELFHLNSACALLQEIHLQAKAPERALEAAEQCRARVLARSLADRAFKRQGRATLPTEQEARAYARKNRVDEGKAYDALIKERLGNPAADAASRPATVADMRRAAAERNATIVVYSIHTEPNRLPDRMPDREVGVTIWVVAPDGQVTARRRSFEGILGEGTLPLTAAVYRAREALDVPGRGALPSAAAKGKPPSSRAAAALRQFHRLLIEPVEDLLPTREGARLLFVPQGALFVVPFPALENPEGVPLVARYAISVVPSVQTLALISVRRQASPATGPALIVGNPVMPIYSPAPGRPPLDIGPLPGAEEEARAIATLLKTSPLTGAAATKDAVMTQARSARYVHLATHGILDDVTGDGQRSANPNVREMSMASMEQREGGGHKTPGMLALAPGGGDNGMLMADEIAQATVGAELVVMSACDSGRGAINDDGVIGLSRAWMSAGAPSVVVSLWSIPDEPTRDLMVEFYRRLSGGSGKAEALREAMLATRVKYPNPVNWAAFVLLGEPN